MWKQLLDLVQQVLTLSKDLERSREDIKELKQQNLSLTLLVQQLVTKMELIAQQERSARELFTQQEKSEREKFMLQMRMEMDALFQQQVATLEKRYEQAPIIDQPKRLPALNAISKRGNAQTKRKRAE